MEFYLQFDILKYHLQKIIDYFVRTWICIVLIFYRAAGGNFIWFYNDCKCLFFLNSTKQNCFFYFLFVTVADA